MTLGFIGPITYMLVVRGLAKEWLGVKLAALVTVGLPFLVNLAIAAIFVTGRDLPPANLLPSTVIITAILQLVVCLVVFSMMQRHNDNIAAWLAIATLGLLANYVLVPQVVGRLLQV